MQGPTGLNRNRPWSEWDVARGNEIVGLKIRGASRHGDRTTRGRGQALVEFALVAPIMVLILTAILQFALIFERQIGLENVVREAARYGATQVTDDGNASNNASTTYLRMLTLLSNAQGYSSADLDSPGTTVCYANGPADPAVQGQVFITATLAYRHPLFIPLIAQILDQIDGTTDGRLLVRTRAQFRVENAEDTNLVAGPYCAP